MTSTPLVRGAGTARIDAHLATWLGGWPPEVRLRVVASPLRDAPGWDGAVRPLAGVTDPGRGTVLSVPPGVVAASYGDLGHALEDLPRLVGAAGRSTYRAVYRWTTDPAPLPDVGDWEPVDPESGLPAWLLAFSAEVLVVRDAAGVVQGGVGLKRHEGGGREIAVGTEPPARGRGVARRLVAQAARRILDEGAVPIYQHAADNVASARVADAAGLPDRGWRSYGISSGT